MKRTTLAVAITAICAGMSINAFAQQSQNGDQATSGGSTEQQETSGAGAQGAQGAQSQTSTEDDDSGSNAQSGNTGSNTDSDDTDTDTDENTAGDGEVTGDSDGQMEGNQGRRPEAMDDPDNREPDPSIAANDTQGGLMSLQISEVEGMTVVNQSGDEIGNVDRIVEHSDSGDLYAVVSIGGFWGFGSTDVALAIQEMALEDDQLVMQTPYGSDEIESATEEYNEDNYSQIDNDMLVGDLANHPN
ncbi:PRC-barrel domain-containing protein [Vreelandella sp. EE22]